MSPRGIVARLRPRKRWPLTRQLAATLASVMLVCSALIITGTQVFDYFEAARVTASLTPSEARAVAMIEQRRMPPVADLRSLIGKQKRIGEEAVERANASLAILVLLGTLIAFLLGYALLGRLGKGLTNVAFAARSVADGDLTARAKPMARASREEAQLALDFNRMAMSLQQAERELAESTAAIAHELRTPLTILRGRLHGLADGVFTLGAHEIDGLIYQVEGLGRLVDDLQTLSLANSSRMVLDCTPTDLGTEVRRVLMAMRPDLEAAGLELVLDFRPAPLVADAMRVRQVIGAVLNNALRYAAGSGMLRIVTWRDEGSAKLEITDRGPGLPEGGGEVAFDRFWRGEASRGRNTGGTGLGLAVVRAIVEAHGGSASLRNHDDGGAMFSMRLPASAPLHTVCTSA